MLRGIKHNYSSLNDVALLFLFSQVGSETWDSVCRFRPLNVPTLKNELEQQSNSVVEIDTLSHPTISVSTTTLLHNPNLHPWLKLEYHTDRRFAVDGRKFFHANLTLVLIKLGTAHDNKEELPTSAFHLANAFFVALYHQGW